ncbi:hypothetical protein ACFL0V_04410 [Nanoarchaeota archaeon]
MLDRTYIGWSFGKLDVFEHLVHDESIDEGILAIPSSLGIANLVLGMVGGNREFVGNMDADVSLSLLAYGKPRSQGGCLEHSYLARSYQFYSLCLMSHDSSAIRVNDPPLNVVLKEFATSRCFRSYDIRIDAPSVNWEYLLQRVNCYQGGPTLCDVHSSTRPTTSPDWTF